MADIINFGKASITVELLDKLPNVTKDNVIFDFDIHANIWPALQQLGQAFPPIFLQTLIDTDKGFTTFFPLKRKYPIDNYIADSSGSSSLVSQSDKPYILWTPITKVSGIVSDVVSRLTKYDLENPPNYSNSYKGPKWENAALSGQPLPNDIVDIQDWIKSIRNDSNTTTTTTTPATDFLPTTYSVRQTVVKDGLWWGLEFSNFLKTNTPFWITIDRAISPPSTKNSTFLIISLGLDDDQNAFDISISTDKKPLLYDYYNGRNGSGNGPAYKVRELPDELTKLWATDTHIEIGFMTVAGKLVIFFNKVAYIYTRTHTKSDKENAQDLGVIREAVIASGKMRIYGSNCQININVSPMTFAPMGIAALPLPVLQSSGDSTIMPKWYGIDARGENHNNGVSRLPQPISVKNAVYGVDCDTFVFRQGNEEEARPYGFGFHRNGVVKMVPASSIGIPVSEGDYYVLYMLPSSVSLNLGKETVIPYSGCPYFFRLKGKYTTQPKTDQAKVEADISSDVFSVTEQYQIDDYFMINGNASVVLYNKNGKYDYLKSSQRGIQISWGWNGIVQKTFTGVITEANSSEVAGKEELTLTCNDYMFLLKNTMIFNSPYYDGMILFYAVKDIVLKAGIMEAVNEWDNTDEYFLPSGYSFTKPSVKFNDTDMLYDCIKSMAQRAEAVVYFDRDGKCHIKKLPGGLLSKAKKEDNVATFSKNPLVQMGSGTSFTIIDTKNAGYSLDQTVNRITVFSLDRDTRDGIVWTKSAKGNEDSLLYRRVLYEEQAMLGRKEVVVARADELAQRVFYPIRQTSFKTVGAGNVVYPLSFCTVDGLEYRIIGLSRKYDAATNNFENEYNCEWLGGK